MATKVFNKGKREIHYAGGVLKPEQVLSLTPATAENLRKLYPREVVLVDEGRTAQEADDQQAAQAADSVENTADESPKARKGRPAKK